jgi:hypothetical protein
MLLTDVKVQHNKVVGLVETMLKLHKDSPKAKTPASSGQVPGTQ